MHRSIRLYLNGRPREADVSPNETALELFRDRFGLRGTKEGCGEGDCGGCTVVIGEVRHGAVRYRPVTSCVMLAAQLDGTHVITVEGLAKGDLLHPIQQAILDAHATQCGFCTPGVVMSLFALLLDNPAPTEEDARAALEGNLCRCTGYSAIRKVADELRQIPLPGKGTPIRPDYLEAVEQALLAEQQVSSLSVGGESRSYHAPRTRSEALAILQELGPKATLINGGTDVVVALRKRHAPWHHLVDIGRLEGLQALKVTPEFVEIGGAVRLAEAADGLGKVLPCLSQVIRTMCSEQVRSLGTVAGNIANASPVADTVPLLLVLGAVLCLDGLRGPREVPLEAFFRGYKDTVREAGEWIASIRIPRPQGLFIHFEKVSKRRELDIASVNGAIALALDGSEIRSAKVAFGGVGPTAILAQKTSSFLEGRSWSLKTAEEGAAIAMEEVCPISDVRSSAWYRKTTAGNILIKHFLACAAEAQPEEGRNA